MTEEQEKILADLDELITEIKAKVHEDSSEYIQAQKDVKPMIELSRGIIDVIRNFEPFRKGQPGWVGLLLMALARATSIITAGMDVIGATRIPAMELYTKVILPMMEANENQSTFMKIVAEEIDKSKEEAN